jgi:hypothetical protein
MTSDLHITHFEIDNERFAAGDQVNVSWAISNTGTEATSGSEHTVLEVQNPDHAPVVRHEIPMSMQVHPHGEQRYHHSFPAPEGAGDYEVFVYADPPHGGTKRGSFAVEEG